MKLFTTLLKREILEAKNGFILVPLVLAGLTLFFVLLSVSGIGGLRFVEEIGRPDMHNLADALTHLKEKEPEQLPAAIAAGYWSASALTWVAFPFVIFFTLLGVLYEERRDRSILFWKSMPVSDTQEVLAKFVAAVVIAPICFLVISIITQIIVMLILSIAVVFQGGPVSALWPVGLMLMGWISAFEAYLIMALWALPLMAWLLFVSSFANRLPFLWALLVPGVLVTIESVFFNTHSLINWIGTHIGGWVDQVDFTRSRVDNFEGPRDLFAFMAGEWQWNTISHSFGSLDFWFGLVVTAGFLFAAIEMRKRATA